MNAVFQLPNVKTETMDKACQIVPFPLYDKLCNISVNGTYKMYDVHEESSRMTSVLRSVDSSMSVTISNTIYAFMTHYERVKTSGPVFSRVHFNGQVGKNKMIRYDLRKVPVPLQRIIFIYIECIICQKVDI